MTAIIGIFFIIVGVIFFLLVVEEISTQRIGRNSPGPLKNLIAGALFIIIGLLFVN